jgi:hypothetical protein
MDFLQIPKCPPLKILSQTYFQILDKLHLEQQWSNLIFILKDSNECLNDLNAFASVDKITY